MPTTPPNTPTHPSLKPSRGLDLIDSQYSLNVKVITYRENLKDCLWQSQWASDFWNLESNLASVTVYLIVLRCVLLYSGVEPGWASGETVPCEGHPPRHCEASTSQTRGQGGSGGWGQHIINIGDNHHNLRLKVGCEVGGEPAPEVTWVTPARGEVTGNLSLLALSQVSRADAGKQHYRQCLNSWWLCSGQYICYADNGAGLPAQATIMLEVQCKYKFSFSFHLTLSNNNLILTHTYYIYYMKTLIKPQVLLAILHPCALMWAGDGCKLI